MTDERLSGSYHLYFYIKYFRYRYRGDTFWETLMFMRVSTSAFSVKGGIMLERMLFGFLHLIFPL